MPFASIGVCCNCGDSFVLSEDECLINSRTSLHPIKTGNKYRPIRSINDWIEHITTFCPECRYPAPPIHVQEQINKLSKSD